MNKTSIGYVSVPGQRFTAGFILGSVLKSKSNVASEIIGVKPENFRKRLELSRKK